MTDTLTEPCPECIIAEPQEDPFRRCAEHRAVTAMEVGARMREMAPERRLNELKEALDDPEQFGWTGLPLYAIAYAAAIRDVKAFLAEEPTMPDTLTPQELAAIRDEIVAAMPWYDESNPDYTELDEVIRRTYTAHIDTLTEKHERFDRSWSHYADDCPCPPTHIDTLTTAVEALPTWTHPLDEDDVPLVSRATVLAILGEPHDA